MERTIETQTKVGEVAIYNPDDSIRLEVRLEQETVWLDRTQLSILFDRDKKTIAKHINTALEEELKGIPTVAKFEIVQQEGDRRVKLVGKDALFCIRITRNWRREAPMAAAAAGIGISRIPVWRPLSDDAPAGALKRKPTGSKLPLLVFPYLTVYERARHSQTQKNHQTNRLAAFVCGGRRIRTGDPMLAKHVLYQLSYTPGKKAGTMAGFSSRPWQS